MHARTMRDQWLSKFVEYSQKINDISPSDNKKLVDKAEEFCINKSEWLKQEDQSKWVDCFKKSSNLEKPSSKNPKDEKSQTIPFQSDKLLQYIQQKGKTACIIKYLKYLTLKCNVPN